MEDNTKLVKRKKHKRNRIETAVDEIILILLILSVIISAIVVIKAASIRTEALAYKLNCLSALTTLAHIKHRNTDNIKTIIFFILHPLFF